MKEFSSRVGAVFRFRGGAEGEEFFQKDNFLNQSNALVNFKKKFHRKTTLNRHFR